MIIINVPVQTDSENRYNRPSVSVTSAIVSSAGRTQRKGAVITLDNPRRVVTVDLDDLKRAVNAL